MCKVGFRLQDKLPTDKIYIAIHAIINRSRSRPVIKSRMQHAIKHDIVSGVRSGFGGSAGE